MPSGRSVLSTEEDPFGKEQINQIKSNQINPSTFLNSYYSRHTCA